jgi:hypothetical protein
MVLVLTRVARQQRHGADAEVAQLGAGRQVDTNDCQVNVPAAPAARSRAGLYRG